jgi:hypothetical protein
MRGSEPRADCAVEPLTVDLRWLGLPPAIFAGMLTPRGPPRTLPNGGAARVSTSPTQKLDAKTPAESTNVSSLRVGNPPMATNPRPLASPASARRAQATRSACWGGWGCGPHLIHGCARPAFGPNNVVANHRVERGDHLAHDGHDHSGRGWSQGSSPGNWDSTEWREQTSHDRRREPRYGACLHCAWGPLRSAPRGSFWP